MSASTAYPTGTLTPSGNGGAGCPTGFHCTGFTVTCSGSSEAITGGMAERLPSSPKGLAMFFQAAGGGTYVPETKETTPFMDDLYAAGISVVEVRWDKGWYVSGSGESAGPARLACRGATVIKWVQTHLYTEKAHGNGACGFCLVGVSGGATVVSYAVANYGMDGIVDSVIPIGGPPHAALVKGCLKGYTSYTYATHTAQNMDQSYGFPGSGGGPCEAHDSGFVSRWTADAVDTGAFDAYYPNTRFVFLFGGADDTIGPAHGQDFADKISNAGSPMVFVKQLPGVPHEPWQSADGMAAVKAAILAAGGPGTVQPPSGGGGGGGGGGGSGGGSGGGTSGGTSKTPAPKPTATITGPTPSPGSSRPGESPLALPPASGGGGFPWVILLVAAVPLAVLAWMLRGRLPFRRAPPAPPD